MPYTGKETVKFFGQLTVPIGWGTTKSGNTDHAKRSSYGVSLSPGLVFFPSKKVGIEFFVTGLYYDHDTYKDNGTPKTISNSFGLDVNSLDPTIGISFYF